MKSNLEKLSSFLTPSKIFLLILISFIFGIFLAGLIKASIFFFAICLIGFSLIALVILFFTKEKIIWALGGCALAIVAGLAYFNWYRQNHLPQHLPFGQEVNIVAIIDEEVSIKKDKQELIIKVIKADNYSQIINQKILVKTKNYPRYNYGDELKISGTLVEPQNYNSFDYTAYLERYQVFSLITNPTNVEFVNKNQGNKIKQALLFIKDRFKKSLEYIFPEPIATLASGILIGAKGQFDATLSDAMIKTGTIHIVVISGQNMEIVAKVFTDLTMYWSRFASFTIGSIGLLLFAILTGATPSVIRSAVLASLFLFVRAVGRKKNLLNPLVFVGFIMILQNPLILRFDLGFQLSFMAMLGLIYVAPVIEKLFVKLPKTINEILAATIGAQLATFPIILYNFGRISIIAPITNALILPAVPAAMLGSFIAGIGGIIYPTFGRYVGYFVWIFLKYIILVIENFCKIPFANVEINFHNWFWLLIYYIIITVVVYITFRLKRNK